MNPPAEPTEHPGPIEWIARGLLISGGHVLVCRNLKHGYCYLPGGHVEFGESAADACAREFLEETGLSVRIGACVLVCEARFEQKGRARHEISAVFLVEHSISDGPPTVSGVPPAVRSLEPKIGFDWIARERLTDSDFRPLVVRNWLIGRVSVGGWNATGRPDWISDPG